MTCCPTQTGKIMLLKKLKYIIKCARARVCTISSFQVDSLVTLYAKTRKHTARNTTGLSSLTSFNDNAHAQCMLLSDKNKYI